MPGDSSSHRAANDPRRDPADLDALVAAQAAGAMDCAMLKLSRLGGISRVRLACDVCRQWGLAMTMEDAGGGDVVTAAMAHLAASTPPQSLRFSRAW